MIDEIATDTFERRVLQATRPVLVDFHTAWCGPCKQMQPLLEGLAAERDGQIDIVKIDVDKAGELAARYGVRGVPTLTVFRDGAPVASHTGSASRAQIGALIDSVA